MNESAEMKDGADLDEAADLDAQAAAAIVEEARERARRELAIKRPVLFVTWGLVVLISYGTVWLLVRGQRPYHGPQGGWLLLLLLLFMIAAVVTAQVVDQAASGVGGWSTLQRGVFCLSLLVGFAALETEKQALSYAGASRPLVALFGEAIPILVIGLVFVATCAITGSLDRPRLALGSWLLAVAVAGAWAGPETNLAICALAGGGGVLLMAAVEPRLRRL